MHATKAVTDVITQALLVFQAIGKPWVGRSVSPCPTPCQIHTCEVHLSRRRSNPEEPREAYVLGLHKSCSILARPWPPSGRQQASPACGAQHVTFLPCTCRCKTSQWSAAFGRISVKFAWAMRLSSSTTDLGGGHAVGRASKPSPRLGEAIVVVRVPGLVLGSVVWGARCPSRGPENPQMGGENFPKWCGRSEGRRPSPGEASQNAVGTPEPPLAALAHACRLVLVERVERSNDATTTLS